MGAFASRGAGALAVLLATAGEAVALEALRRTGGRKAAAADLLGISPRTTSYYLERYPDLEAIIAAEGGARSRGA